MVIEAEPLSLPAVEMLPDRVSSHSEYSPSSIPSQSTNSTLNFGPAVRPSVPSNERFSSVAIPEMPPSIFCRNSPEVPSGTFRPSTPIDMLSR